MQSRTVVYRLTLLLKSLILQRSSSSFRIGQINRLDRRTGLRTFRLGLGLEQDQLFTFAYHFARCAGELGDYARSGSA